MGFFQHRPQISDHSLVKHSQNFCSTIASAYLVAHFQEKLQVKDFGACLVSQSHVFWLQKIKDFRIIILHYQKSLLDFPLHQASTSPQNSFQFQCLSMYSPLSHLHYYIIGEKHFLLSIASLHFILFMVVRIELITLQHQSCSLPVNYISEHLLFFVMKQIFTKFPDLF